MVPNLLFDFESATELSIKREEICGHLDNREIGYGLYSDSPLTTPEPTPPQSPTQKLTSTLDNPPHFPLDLSHPAAVGDSASPSAGQVNKVENKGKKYKSNKKRSHAKRKLDRAERRKEHEANAHPYEPCPATRQTHICTSNTVRTGLDLAGIPISKPGFIGLRDMEEVKDTGVYMLQDMVGPNSRFKFKLQKWDGR